MNSRVTLRRALSDSQLLGRSLAAYVGDLCDHSDVPSLGETGVVHDTLYIDSGYHIMD